MLKCAIQFYDPSILLLFLTNEGDASLIGIDSLDWQLSISKSSLYIELYKHRLKFRYNTYKAKCGYINQTMIFRIRTSYIVIYVIYYFCIDVMVIYNLAYEVFYINFIEDATLSYFGNDLFFMNM